MIATIKKWGNSQGLRFSKDILFEMGIEVDDEVNIEIKDKKMIITKAKNLEVDLKELFMNYNGEYKPSEIDWGKPRGDEVW